MSPATRLRSARLTLARLGLNDGAKLWNSCLDLKVMQKIQIFRLIMSCAKNSYWNLKVMQKNSDFQANYELYQGFLLRFKSVFVCF